MLQFLTITLRTNWHILIVYLWARVRLSPDFSIGQCQSEHGVTVSDDDYDHALDSMAVHSTTVRHGLARYATPPRRRQLKQTLSIVV